MTRAREPFVASSAVVGLGTTSLVRLPGGRLGGQVVHGHGGGGSGRLEAAVLLGRVLRASGCGGRELRRTCGDWHETLLLLLGIGLLTQVSTASGRIEGLVDVVLGVGVLGFDHGVFLLDARIAGGMERRLLG